MRRFFLFLARLGLFKRTLQYLGWMESVGSGEIA